MITARLAAVAAFLAPLAITSGAAMAAPHPAPRAADDLGSFVAPFDNNGLDLATNGCTRQERQWAGGMFMVHASGPSTTHYDAVYRGTLRVSRAGHLIGSFLVKGIYVRENDRTVDYDVPCQDLAQLTAHGYGARPATYTYQLVDGTVRSQGVTHRMGDSGRLRQRVHRLYRALPIHETAVRGGVRVTAKTQKWITRSGRGTWVATGAGVPVRHFVGCRNRPQQLSNRRSRVTFSVTPAQADPIELSIPRSKERIGFWGSWYHRHGAFAWDGMGQYCGVDD